MLLQPAGVTKPSYPGSYDGGWATLHREAKNSSDWAARREWTQTALTGWAAFMVRNDDAAVTSHGLCSWLRCCELCSYFPVFSPIIITGRQCTPAARMVHISCMHNGIYFLMALHTLQKARHRRPFLRYWCRLPFPSSLRTVIGIALWGDYHLLPSWCHAKDLPAPVLPFMAFGSKSSACREKKRYPKVIATSLVCRRTA